jgi:hypothetical protein
MVGVAYPFARGRLLEPKPWKRGFNLPIYAGRMFMGAKK